MSVRQFLCGQHAFGAQPCIPINQSMMLAQLVDMYALKKPPLKGTVALLVELLSNLRISRHIEQAIHGLQGLW